MCNIMAAHGVCGSVSIGKHDVQDIKGSQMRPSPAADLATPLCAAVHQTLHQHSSWQKLQGQESSYRQAVPHKLTEGFKVDSMPSDLSRSSSAVRAMQPDAQAGHCHMEMQQMKCCKQSCLGQLQQVCWRLHFVVQMSSWQPTVLQASTMLHS